MEKTTGAQGVAPRDTPRSALPVDGNSAAESLLPPALSQGRHALQTGEKRKDALEKRFRARYGVALSNFRLPGLGGAEAKQHSVSERETEDHPSFASLDGNTEEPLRNDAGTGQFKDILPDPIDIDAVARIVDAYWKSARRLAGDATDKDKSDPGASYSLDTLDYTFLHWPLDATSPGKLQNLDLTRFDAILIRKETDCSQLWTFRGAQLLPVIDLTGELGTRADIRAADLGIEDEAPIRELVERFRLQRNLMHHDMVRTDDPGEKLIGRLFVSGADLRPRLDGRQRGLVAYNAIAEPAQVEEALALLAAQDLVELTFFDRFHQCDTCRSSRLFVREVCPRCGNSDLTDETYIHHFRCAYQGPESDFRKGDDLTCPKCRRNLGKFGIDYDRPGTTSACGKCGHSSSEPDVSFTCTDCGTAESGDRIGSRDVYSARLKPQARELATSGYALTGLVTRRRWFADLPIDLIGRLDRFARHYGEGGAPFTLTCLSYDRQPAMMASAGRAQFDAARSQFLENLRHEMPASALVRRGTTQDYVIEQGADPDECRRILSQYVAAAQDTVRLDLGVRFDVLTPKELAS